MHPAGHITVNVIEIRAASEADVPAIAALIRGLAEYEKLLDQLILDEQQLQSHLFGEVRFAEALVAQTGNAGVIGFALFFHNYSTFRGQPGMYLEDLFVLPEHRGRGAGKALLRALARIAVQRGCGRLEWSVLDWNTPAIGFYRAIGAVPMEEWTVYRLTGEALETFANTDR
jgi:GNAT superfamily N-acetyltransferase